MMMRAAALVLLLTCLATCAQSGRSTGSPAARFPVKIHWTQGAAATPEDQTVKIHVAEREVWVGTVPSHGSVELTEIKVPPGLNRIHVDVVGKASATMLVMGAPDQEIDLFLNYPDKPIDAAASPDALFLTYQIHDDSTCTALPTRSSAKDASPTVPITLDVYDTDSGAPRGSADHDEPLRVYIDNSLVYDGVVRAGNLVGAEFVFRVKPGVHMMRFVSDGDEKTCPVNAASTPSVSVYLGKKAVSPIRTIVSNDVVPSM